MTASEGSSCYPAVRAREWGKIASNVPDPPQCIDNCGRKFLEKLVPGFRDSKWTETCGILSKTETTKQLWDLYCCNSSICGVFPSMGQDPGVNYIVNTCHNSRSGTASFRIRLLGRHQLLGVFKAFLPERFKTIHLRGGVLGHKCHGCEALLNVDNGHGIDIFQSLSTNIWRINFKSNAW
ncbi:hypothetical protein RB213_010290 [Colletotrichum asianum]